MDGSRNFSDLDNHNLVPIDKITITNEDEGYSVAGIDDYHLSLINNIGSGHRVILTTPDVKINRLLLLKALKFAKLNQGSKVLITCYSRNLANIYKLSYLRYSTLFSDNIYIMPFYSIVQKIYKDILKKEISGEFPNDDEIQKSIELAKYCVLKLKFDAIFIDEIHAFKQEYIELCYELLDKQPNNIFLMAGDLKSSVITYCNPDRTPQKVIDSDVSLDLNNISIYDFRTIMEAISRKYSIENIETELLDIYPIDYKKRGRISKEERVLIKYARDYFQEGYLITGINVPGINSGLKIGMYISPKNGVITFSIMNSIFMDERYKRHSDEFINNFYSRLINKYEDEIYQLFSDDNMPILKNINNNILKFPYKHIIFFADKKRLFVPINRMPCDVNHLFDRIDKPYDRDFECLSESEIHAIIEKIAPESAKDFVKKRKEDIYHDIATDKDEMDINEKMTQKSKENNKTKLEVRNKFMHIYPVDFEKRDHITKEERVLIRFVLDKFPEGYFITGTDTLGLSAPNVKMGMYLSPKEGLITFSIIKNSFDKTVAKAIYPTLIKTIEDKIHERLLDAKMLIVKTGNYKILKFPYKHILIFSNDKTIDVDEETANILEGKVTANLFTPINKKPGDGLHLFDRIDKEYDTDFKGIADSDIPAIIERIAPEYAITMIEKEDTPIKENNKLVPIEKIVITKEEDDYKSFMLDDYQVSLVNDMGSGHRVILANPGAGKSVLLLSKAMKFASLNPESKVLLTCYNSNLAESYNLKYTRANFVGRNNLDIYTLHKLVQKIYDDILNKRIHGAFPSDEEIQKCIDLAKAGLVKLKYGAIFIDEVQIFDPKYIELCYYLLDKQPNNIFLMTGDLNQTVRSQSRRGDAPWKKIEGISLDFTGRVKYIERNYRNSKHIGEYLNEMLKYMNFQMNKHGMINSKEFDYNTFEVGDVKSIALNIRTGINRMSIKQEIIDAIREIHTYYKINYSDIAILLPYKEHKLNKYYILYWIRSALDAEGIHYSMIMNTNEYKNEKTRISELNGIVISTIDSSLGLDFKAVILTGLYPYNYIVTDQEGVSYPKKNRIDSWSDVNDLTDEEKEIMQIHMRKLYTAASRAREVLYILSDLNEGSPMEDILLDRS